MRTPWTRARSRWSVVSLGGSVVLAVATGVLLHGYLTRVAVRAGGEGPPIPVLVARHRIARGAAITAAAVTLVQMPRALAPPGSFSRFEPASGRVALTDLSSGEAVTETRLARVRAGPVASLIPRGLRAFAVPCSLPAGSVSPGDRIDVLATYRGEPPRTEIVVASAQVLAVLSPSGRAIGRPAGADDVGLDGFRTAGGQTMLMVLVAPEQEAHLAQARALGQLEVTVASAEETPS